MTQYRMDAAANDLKDLAGELQDAVEAFRQNPSTSNLNKFREISARMSDLATIALSWRLVAVSEGLPVELPEEWGHDDGKA